MLSSVTVIVSLVRKLQPNSLWCTVFHGCTFLDARKGEMEGNLQEKADSEPSCLGESNDVSY